MYGTTITAKANARAGYTFKWNDDNTNLTRTFELTEATTLTPVYTAKTNIPYKVEHYKQNIDNDDYTMFEKEDCVGTTDTMTAAIEKEYIGYSSKEFEQAERIPSPISNKNYGSSTITSGSGRGGTISTGVNAGGSYQPSGATVGGAVRPSANGGTNRSTVSGSGSTSGGGSNFRQGGSSGRGTTTSSYRGGSGSSSTSSYRSGSGSGSTTSSGRGGSSSGGGGTTSSRR